MGYQEKLLHHYHELNSLQKIRYNLFSRLDFTKRDRFFFEGCHGNPGQMFLAERRCLYNTILKYKPRHCFEVGTYTGGGSTYFLASAFAELGHGKVITMESDEHYYNIAKDFYYQNLSHLVPHVEFIHGSGIECFLPFLQEDNIDCFFLDGAENSRQTLEQYTFFEKFAMPGTVLMAHDWETEKMVGLRPFLKEKNFWETMTLLSPPESVGFVVMKHE